MATQVTDPALIKMLSSAYALQGSGAFPPSSDGTDLPSAGDGRTHYYDPSGKEIGSEAPGTPPQVIVRGASVAPSGDASGAAPTLPSLAPQSQQGTAQPQQITDPAMLKMLSSAFASQQQGASAPAQMPFQPQPSNQGLPAPVAPQSGDSYFQSVINNLGKPASGPDYQPGALGNTSQALSGVNIGMANTLGFLPFAANSVLRAGAAGVHAAGGPDVQFPTEPLFGGQWMQQHLFAPSIGAPPPASDTAASFARNTGEQVGSNIIPGLSQLSRSSRVVQDIGSLAASSLGAAGGQTFVDQYVPQDSPIRPYADIAAQIAGAIMGHKVPGAVRKAITPHPIAPERQAMVATMKQEGVDLTPGQITGDKPLQYKESELGAHVVEERQKEQFTAAVLAKAGVGAKRATPEVMDGALNDFNKVFEDLGKAYTLRPDAELAIDLHNAVTEYRNNVPKSMQSPRVDKILQDISNELATHNRTISGSWYVTARSEIAAAARAASDPYLANALRDINSALDGAMERSIAKINPDEANAFRQIRNDYRNFLVIENAVSKAGADAANGLISPANLRAAVVQQGKRAYVRGRSDYGDLARAGVTLMTPLPNSGTAGRLVANKGKWGMLPMGAAATYLVAHHSPAEIAAASAGFVLPKVIAGAKRGLHDTPSYNRYLVNQMLKPTAPSNFAAPMAGIVANQAGDQNTALTR